MKTLAEVTKILDAKNAEQKAVLNQQMEALGAQLAQRMDAFDAYMGEGMTPMPDTAVTMQEQTAKPPTRGTAPVRELSFNDASSLFDPEELPAAEDAFNQMEFNPMFNTEAMAEIHERRTGVKPPSPKFMFIEEDAEAIERADQRRRNPTPITPELIFDPGQKLGRTPPPKRSAGAAGAGPSQQPPGAVGDPSVLFSYVPQP